MLIEARWQSRLGDDGVDGMLRWLMLGLAAGPVAVGLLIAVISLEWADVLPPPVAAAIFMGGLGGYFVGMAAIFRGIKMRVGRRLGFARRQSRRLKLDSPTRFDASVQRIQAKAQG
ncbi:hypothetical protein ACGIF2_02035 [Cellulomonas sp. P22]|uniref:hypothetical protein n=1 Tax=Cellulomonas sp. P22 TaxID=3373189 RepID=UPI00378F9A8E